MKRIAFLIVATLMVLAFVLPGCTGGGGGFENWITFGVVGPMSNIQGRDHWAGAVMARDEINDAGGVKIGDKTYGIKLIKIDTNEIVDTSGETGVTEITKVIDKVDFFVGGFRTEAVDVYMDTIMEAKKLFIQTGAATNSLCEKVWDDYDTYKYFFRGSPYNSTFLVTSCFKILGSVNSAAKAAIGATTLTLAVLYENAEWALPMLPYIAPTCAALGIQYLGSASVESNASTVASALQTIAAMNDEKGPHIVFTILSGPPGKAYGIEQDDYLPYVISTGINVESQDIGYHEWTGAEYHIGLDTWAPNTALSEFTLDWFEDFKAETGRYPTYCAATYDAIMAIVDAIKDVGLDTDDIIAWLEDLDNARVGVAGKTAFYPADMLDLTSLNITGLKCGLSYGQAVALYPHLPAMYGLLLGMTPEQVAGNWTLIMLGTIGNNSTSLYGFTNKHGFIPHDLVYGPGWQTGQGVQWQPEDPEHPEGDWAKLGWWPRVVTGTGANKKASELSQAEMGTLLTYGLCDKYGNWNMAYEGAVTLTIPQAFIDHWTS